MINNVTEWTKAETGVRASIAAGSQQEKGMYTLLVNSAVIIKIIIIFIFILSMN